MPTARRPTIAPSGPPLSEMRDFWGLFLRTFGPVYTMAFARRRMAKRIFSTILAGIIRDHTSNLYYWEAIVRSS